MDRIGSKGSFLARSSNWTTPLSTPCSNSCTVHPNIKKFVRFAQLSKPLGLSLKLKFAESLSYHNKKLPENLSLNLVSRLTHQCANGTMHSALGPKLFLYLGHFINRFANGGLDDQRFIPFFKWPHNRYTRNSSFRNSAALSVPFYRCLLGTFRKLSTPLFLQRGCNKSALWSS